MAPNVQTGYTLVVEGVVGVPEGMDPKVVAGILEDVRNVSVKIAGLEEYHPDGVELTYLDMEGWDD